MTHLRNEWTIKPGDNKFVSKIDRINRFLPTELTGLVSNIRSFFVRKKKYAQTQCDPF